jgi:hypothetical protein
MLQRVPRQVTTILALSFARSDCTNTSPTNAANVARNGRMDVLRIAAPRLDGQSVEIGKATGLRLARLHLKPGC